MLKIKMIMAALLAIGFASSTFASEGDENAAPKKTAKTHGGAAKASGGAAGAGTVMKANQIKKWTQTGDELKEECNRVCTKAECKKAQGGHTIAAECAKNCRKVVPYTLVDCTIGAFVNYCGAYAKADEATAAKLAAKKDAGDERCLMLAKANNKILEEVYKGRDNEGSATQKTWQDLKELDAAAAAA